MMRWLSGWRVAALAALLAAVLGTALLVRQLRADLAVAEATAGQAKAYHQAVQAARAADARLTQRQAVERAAQTVARQEFDHATDHLPPARLSDRERIDLCGELRHAGIAEADLAECRDVPSRAPPGP